MPLTLLDGEPSWFIRKIGVVGPGIVGMPMAAMLADARVSIGSDVPAPVSVVQRNSASSGWKVDAINAGRSPIGGVEPDLARIVARSREAGLLSATHSYEEVSDADVILVAVQTDRDGDGPDYGPLNEAMTGLAKALRGRPRGTVPLIVFESTLAPSSMTTVVREHFASHGIVEGRDVLLGNSPNRVMPGRLVERVVTSDKLVAGLDPLTPLLIRRLYSNIVTKGTLHATNSMTAEVVKVLENAYRDVRIAFAAEIARDCDARGLDFFALRDAVNERLAQSDSASMDPTAVPTGGLLVPTVGVGGHCLPKDGILLWWRAKEAGLDASRSRILRARKINDASPGVLLAMVERSFGSLEGRNVALMGVSYRADSEDTRNSPTLKLARLLADRGACVTMHDPFVSVRDQNLVDSGFAERFTVSLADAVGEAELLIFCQAHAFYVNGLAEIAEHATHCTGIVDGCNVVPRGDDSVGRIPVIGIGKGKALPSEAEVEAVLNRFRALDKEVAREVRDVIAVLNDRYADIGYNRVQFSEVRRLAATCSTGCSIVDPD